MGDLFDFLMGFNEPILGTRKKKDLGNGFYTDETGQLMHDMVLREYPEKDLGKEIKISDDEIPTAKEEEKESEIINNYLYCNAFNRKGDKWYLNPFGPNKPCKNVDYEARVTKDGKLVIELISKKSKRETEFSFEFKMKRTFDLPLESDWSTVKSYKNENGAIEFSVDVAKHAANADSKYVVYDYKDHEPSLSKKQNINGLTDDVKHVGLSNLSEKDIDDRLSRKSFSYNINFYPDKFKFVLYDDVYVYRPSFLLADPDYEKYRTVWVDHGVLKYNVVCDYTNIAFEDPDENTILSYSVNEYQISLPVDSDWSSARAIKGKDGGLIIVVNRNNTENKEYTVK